MKKTVLKGIDRALEFIGSTPSEFQIEVRKLVRKEVFLPNVLGTHVSILWFRNEAFMKLCQKHNVDIEKKEIVLTKDYVRATDNYHVAPHLIHEGPLF